MNPATTEFLRQRFTEYYRKAVLVAPSSLEQREWPDHQDKRSFPSGHAARAFLIAVVASALAPAWLGVLLWIWAPLVSIARVAMGVHYVSDVVAGAAVGIIVALIGLQIYEPLLTWFVNLIHFPLW